MYQARSLGLWIHLVLSGNPAPMKSCSLSFSDSAVFGLVIRQIPIACICMLGTGVWWRAGYRTLKCQVCSKGAMRNQACWEVKAGRSGVLGQP